MEKEKGEGETDRFKEVDRGRRDGDEEGESEREKEAERGCVARVCVCYLAGGMSLPRPIEGV
jgi:hypothetical protein